MMIDYRGSQLGVCRGLLGVIVTLIRVLYNRRELSWLRTGRKDASNPTKSNGYEGWLSDLCEGHAGVLGPHGGLRLGGAGRRAATPKAANRKSAL